MPHADSRSGGGRSSRSSGGGGGGGGGGATTKQGNRAKGEPKKLKTKKNVRLRCEQRAAEKNRASPSAALEHVHMSQTKRPSYSGRLFFLPRPAIANVFRSGTHRRQLFLFCLSSIKFARGPPCPTSAPPRRKRSLFRRRPHALATPVPPPQRSNSSCSIASRPRTPKMRPKHLGDISSAIRTCLP